MGERFYAHGLENLLETHMQKIVTFMELEENYHSKSPLSLLSIQFPIREIDNT